MLLPKIGYCSLEHMQQILCRQKWVIPKSNCSRVEIPCWADISVKVIWPLVKDRERFRKYIPESWYPNGKRIDRDYMWSVLTYLYPAWTHEIVCDIRTKRKARKDAKARQQIAYKPDIPIAEEWARALLSQPFKPSKCLLV